MDQFELNPLTTQLIPSEQRPYYPINVTLAVPAAANTQAFFQLYPTYQMGIIRASALTVSDLVAAAASNTTFSLKNLYNETIFETVIQALTTPFAGVFWTFTGIYIPFKEGLQLVITTGSQAGNSGLASVTVIWSK